MSNLEYVFGMPLSFVPGTQFLGGINIYDWKLLNIDIDHSNLYNEVLKYNFCTCVNDYNDDCDCLNVVATMLVRREVHKVVAYFKNDFQFQNPTTVQVQCGGWRNKEFDVSVFRHDQSIYCLCDNFSAYIQVNWDEVVGESGPTLNSFENTLHDLFFNSPGAREDVRTRSIQPPSANSYMFYPLDKPCAIPVSEVPPFTVDTKYGSYTKL